MNIKTLTEKTLRSLPFVRWDRFVPFKTQKCDGIEVYGWIDRPQDAYKDFLTLTIYSDGQVDFNTSSAKYSLPIFRILNAGSGRGHRRCKRVEHFFRVRNAIKLKRKV